MSKASLMRTILRTLVLLSLLLVAGVWLLYVNQDKLIYNAQRISPAITSSLPAGINALEYQADLDGKLQRQVSFVIYPTRTTAPNPVIMIFHGKKDLANNWFNFAQRLSANHPESYILLMEYPGYGLCEGEPNPENILTANRSAVKKLVEVRRLSQKTVDASATIIGHSLGTALALNYAAKYTPRIIVLSAPFTSATDMAKRMVGPLLSNLLTHRYDSKANLKKIMQKGRTSVAILHGDSDEVIPVQMGRELAAVSDKIAYTEIKGADHKGVVKSPEFRQAVGIRPESP